IRLKQNPKWVVHDAWGGLGGPLFGAIGAWVTLALARALGSELLLAVGHATVTLQLFNLLPIYPLDGGRAASILTGPLWVRALVATHRAFDPEVEALLKAKGHHRGDLAWISSATE